MVVAPVLCRYDLNRRLRSLMMIGHQESNAIGSQHRPPHPRPHHPRLHLPMRSREDGRFRCPPVEWRGQHDFVEEMRG